jgi:hypothetical protein
VLLGIIFSRVGFIRLFLLVAGVMYMADTVAHFVLPNYEEYASIFLLFVAGPAIVGEMSFAIWLLVKGARNRDSHGRAGLAGSSYNILNSYIFIDYHLRKL